MNAAPSNLAVVGAVHGMPPGTPYGRPGWGAADRRRATLNLTQSEPLQGGHAGCLRHPADRPYEK